MTSPALSINQVFIVNVAFAVEERTVPVNTRAVVVKGGKNPHIEFLVNNDSEILAVAGTANFFNRHLVVADPFYDEALKDYSVKNIKYAQGEESMQIYLELFKGGKLVATGHNSGKGEGNYLSFVNSREREYIETFLDETFNRHSSLSRSLIGEEFVVFLALYFNSGFCIFESFLKMDN